MGKTKRYTFIKAIFCGSLSNFVKLKYMKIVNKLSKEF